MHERRYERHGVVLTAQLVFDGRAVACEICNLSLGGAMIRLDAPLAQGADVTLDIDPYGRLAATAVWNRGDLSGIRFRDSSAHVGEILAAVASYSGV